MLEINLLNKSHNRNFFDCGNDPINKYLKQQANQSAKKSYSQTHVLIDDANPTRIMGFYTLTSCFINTELQDLLNLKSTHELCGLKLARMGVDIKFQKQDNSQYLIRDAIEKTCQVNSSMGVQGLFLDAKNDDLVRYYEHCGFISILDTNREMWIPIGLAQNTINLK